MTGPSLLDDLKIASPCPASWSAMSGDDRARFCSLCDKHVYNIAALTTTEVGDLIRQTQGEFCGRIYRRKDGTVLTADCPVGAKAFSSGRLHRVMTYAVLGLSTLLGFAALGANRSAARQGPPTGPGSTYDDWKEWARTTLGIGDSAPERGYTAGSICPIPPATSAVPVPTAPGPNLAD